MVVGWAIESHRDEALVAHALEMALGRRQPSPGLLHHSERGSQYTSWDHRARLAQAGITVSMSRKGDCYDNAMMESFFSSFKAERIEGRIYQSRSQARQAIFEYLETFYNRQRLHSSLEYQSPVQFEQQNT